MGGSGKTTVCKLIAARLGFAHYSSGDFARTLALASNSSIDEHVKNVTSGAPIDYDEKIDKWIKEKSTEDKFIIDSRLAFHWLDGFNVFLRLPAEEAAQRRFLNQNGVQDASKRYESEEQVLQEILLRLCMGPKLLRI